MMCLRRSAVALGCALAVACSSSVLPTAPTTPAALVAASVTPEPPAPAVAPEPIAAAPDTTAGNLTSLAIEPARFQGGTTVIGTVSLATAAPLAGTLVTLTSSDRDVRPPATITISGDQTVGMFRIATSEPHADTDVRLTATTSDGSATANIVVTLPVTYYAMDGTTRSNEAHVWLSVTAPIAPPTPAPTPAPTPPPSGSQTFSFTGSAQTFTVPDGVTQITMKPSALRAVMAAVPARA